MAVTLQLNGVELVVQDDRAERTLLDVLRTEGGIVSAKDGCAPQGQCGCCTVIVDGKARVSCVTPLRRVAGRSVLTVEGLDPPTATRWADAFMRHGASQCGFCTPGIVMRLEARRMELDAGSGTRADPLETSVQRALGAHLCRCTGWQGITDAAVEILSGAPGSGPTRGRRGGSEDGSLRASIETAGPQRIDREVVLGRGGFAADTAPADALLALCCADGSWIVAEDLPSARALAGKVQGRRSTLDVHPPLGIPEGDWTATLATSWVEPAYLETDASWCTPGGEPVTVLANGGAFGAKVTSPVPAAARRLADEHGRTVLAMWSREDVVRRGPKRPPVGLGVRPDGTGLARVVATPGIAAAISAAAPGLVVEEVSVRGPMTTSAVRAAGWAEGVCAMVAVDATSPFGGRDGSAVRVEAPGAGWARVGIVDRSVVVEVGPGDPLDEAVLRSVVIGAVHMAAGWVCSEGLAVDSDGAVQDLTIRSFGILSASAMPRVEVHVDREGARGAPVAVGEAVFAATSAALWWHHDFSPRWPLGTEVL